MLTVLEAITLSTEYLQKKGIESARLNAELLLAEILKCRRLDLYLKFERPLSEAEKAKYREFIRRRGIGEPVQYIIGHTEFFGLDFEVNSSVLIPRPETEILVENVIAENANNGRLRILDIGSGSGNISVALAKNLPDSLVVGIDISEEAVTTAKANAKSNKIENVEFLKADVFNFRAEESEKFDILVSNPPYVSESDYGFLQKEIIDFEPKIAVTDDGDGFKYFEHICEHAHDFLRSGGKLYFETALGQTEKINSMMEKNGITNTKVITDLQNIDRIISGEVK